MSAPPPLPVAAPPLPKAGGAARFVIAGATVLLYIASLVPPAVMLKSGEQWPGWHMLVMGWLAIFIGQIGWFANLVLLLSVVLLLCKRPGVAAGFAVLAVLIGLTSFSLANTEIPMDEGGINKQTVESFGPAIYLWLASLGLPALGILFRPSKA